MVWVTTYVVGVASYMVGVTTHMVGEEGATGIGNPYNRGAHGERAGIR